MGSGPCRERRPLAKDVPTTFSNGDYMADQTQTPLREDTYSSFIGMVKVGSIVTAIVAAVVVALIAS